MEVFVIKEYYSDFSEPTIIGVSDSVDKSKEMINEYFGETFIMDSFEDIRDSGIEYKMKGKSIGSRGEIYISSIVVDYLTLNKI